MKNINKMFFILISMMLAVSQLNANVSDTITTKMTASINKSTRTLTLVCIIINSTDNGIYIPVSAWQIDGFEQIFGVWIPHYYYVNHIQYGKTSAIADGCLSYEAKYVPQMIYVESEDTANLKVIVKDIDTSNLHPGKIGVDMAFTDWDMMMEMRQLFVTSNSDENIELEATDPYIIELKYDKKVVALSTHSNVKTNKTLLTCLRMAFLKELFLECDVKIE